MEPASTKQVFDVLVVGNGVLGTSTALVLARRRLKVALVGDRHRPGAASSAAGAMLGCFGEVTASLLRSRHGRAKLALDVRATSCWDDWLASLDQDGDGLRTANGTVVLLNAIGMPEVDTVNFLAICTALRDFEQPFSEVDPHDIDGVPLRSRIPTRSTRVDRRRSIKVGPTSRKQ